MSESPTIVKINDVIKNIGYIALCISILLFLIIKILKYLLARKKFKLNMSLSQLNTPISKSPLSRLSEPGRLEPCSSSSRSCYDKPQRVFTP